MTMTQEQVDAVIAAQIDEPELAELQPEQVAQILAQRGHAAFAATVPPADLDAGAPAQLATVDQAPQVPDVQRPAGYVPEGMEELGGEDFQTPSLKIRQPTTRDADNVEEGNWFNTLDHSRNAAEVAFAVLAIRPYNVWQSPYEDASDAEKEAVLARAAELGVVLPPGHEGPICSSPDRLSPLTGQPHVPRSSCKGCPAGMWRSTRSGKRTKDCTSGYRLIAFDLTDYEGNGEALEPVIIRVQSSAMRPWKRCQTLLMAKARRHKLPAHAFLIRATTEKAAGKPYYIPRFAPPELIKDDELRTVLAEAYASFAAKE